MAFNLEDAVETKILPGTLMKTLLVGRMRWTDYSGSFVLNGDKSLRDRLGEAVVCYPAVRVVAFNETSIRPYSHGLDWNRGAVSSGASLMMLSLDCNCMGESRIWESEMSWRANQELIALAKRRNIRALILDHALVHASNLQHALHSIQYLVIVESDLADRDQEAAGHCIRQAFGRNQSLTHVFLHGTNLAIPIMVALSHHVLLQKLDVSLPHSTCAWALQELLSADPPHLVELTIADTEFTESITRHVMNGLDKNTRVKTLRFDSCTWDTSLEPGRLHRLQTVFFARMFAQCPQCWLCGTVLIRGNTDFDKHKLAVDYFGLVEDMTWIFKEDPDSLFPFALASAFKEANGHSVVFRAIQSIPHMLGGSEQQTTSSMIS